ncbi:DUF4494 domain-containing protein [Cesiribacter andamanensis]|uniref:DUF4494 domain-containing protein n=1 Tax=Cesiribacter andamanensis AMV16 TaxID=1279009 RepID=M7NT01_9BACT|nr:DUF4494 domain-containing protein [Cesiribacter andamanensis]EMR04795.1 hypothetical protein ADICEAN_00066 [Cesiribacter andamanensis AMV16]
MKIWFQCKIKYQKEDENGRLKNVTEPYLVDAVSYTEAEARIYQELGSVIRGDFEVTSITKSKISDIFHYDDAETWYKCKVTYIAADDESGKEKKVTNQMLVSALDLKQACERLLESLEGILVQFEVVEIQQSPLVEIFPYVEDETKGKVRIDDMAPQAVREEEVTLKPIPPTPALASQEEDEEEDSAFEPQALLQEAELEEELEAELDSETEL